MKKIPTLFKRTFEGHRIASISSDITPGCEEAFKNGIATVKIDGSCCAVIDGIFYKRYDAKKGKTPPDGAIPCCDPDPVTGHFPHWVRVDENDSNDKWFIRAFESLDYTPGPGTYEVIGPHFNGNPYNLTVDILEPHGFRRINVDRDFNSIKKWLENNAEEGLVFWLNGEPVCKIKRSDFGLKWPIK